MGIVYEAQEVELGRHVALKLMPELFSVDQQLLDLFDAECRSLARITHPRVVPVYRTGWQDDSPYLVMEFLPRGSLGEHLDRFNGVAAKRRSASVLPCHVEGDTYVDTCIRIVLQVLDGLAAIHQQGLVHRDLKPDNLMLTANGEIKIGDFGLAKDIATSSGHSSRGRRRGTPAYMSPEQAAGNFMGLDHRSDLFSVGIILYELLAGRRPFERESELELTRETLLTKPIPIRKHNRDVNRDLARVIDRALEKNADHRYSDARSFAADLERCLRGEPIVFGKLSVHDRLRRFIVSNSNTASAGFLVSLLGLGFLLLLVTSNRTLGSFPSTIAVCLMLACAGAGHALALLALVQRRSRRKLAVVTLCIHAVLWVACTIPILSYVGKPKYPDSRAEFLAAIPQLEGISVEERSRNDIALLAVFNLFVGDYDAVWAALDESNGGALVVERNRLGFDYLRGAALLEQGRAKDALQIVHEWESQLGDDYLEQLEATAQARKSMDFITRVEPVALHVLGDDAGALEAAAKSESCADLHADIAALQSRRLDVRIPTVPVENRMISTSHKVRRTIQLPLRHFNIEELLEQVTELRYPWFEGDFYVEATEWPEWPKVFERLEKRFGDELAGCPAPLLPRASRLLWLSGDHERAERYALAALERVSPSESLRNVAEAYETLARVSLEQGAFDEAVERAEKAFTLCPSVDDLPRLEAVLSNAYQASGRIEHREELAELVRPLIPSRRGRESTGIDASGR